MPDKKEFKPFKTLQQELDEARLKKMRERKEAREEIERRKNEKVNEKTPETKDIFAENLIGNKEHLYQPVNGQPPQKAEQESFVNNDKPLFENKPELDTAIDSLNDLLTDINKKAEDDKKYKDRIVSEYKAAEAAKEEKKKQAKELEEEMEAFGERIKRIEEKKEKREREEPEPDLPLSDTLVQTQETFADKTFEILGELLHTELGVLSIVISTLMIPVHTWRMFRDFYEKREDEATLAMRALMFVGGVTLAALTIVAVIGVVSIAGPILVIVGAAKGLTESGWELGKSIYDRFAGMGKKEEKNIDAYKTEIKSNLRDDLRSNPATVKRLTESINTQRQRNQAVVNRTHSLIVAGTALVGAALLFTPAAPVGLAILAAVTVYSVGFAVANLIRKKTQGKPILNFFPPKTETEVISDLKKEISHEKREEIEMQPLKTNAKVLTVESPKAQKAQLSEAKLHETTADIFKKVANDKLSPVTIATKPVELSDVSPPVASESAKPVPTLTAKQKESQDEKEGEGEGERKSNGNHGLHR